MSTEENKALVHRLFDGFNTGNTQIADDLLHPNYQNHDFPAPAPGIEGWKMVNAMFRTAFPDMRVVIEDEVAEGNKVAARGYFTGTHQGEFMSIPPTGKPVRVKYIDIWTVADGKLKDNWIQMDMLGLMQQLGVVPAPGQSSG
jgi:predicted ester cyclase